CSWGTSRDKILSGSISVYLCLKTGHAMRNDATHATYPQRFVTKRGRSSAWRCSRRGVRRCHTAGSPGMMNCGATPGFGRLCARAASAMVWGGPVPRRCATWRPHCRSMQGVDGVPRPCTIKEESRSGRIELDLGDPLARSAPQGLHLECRHGTCTRARETVGYLW